MPIVIDFIDVGRSDRSWTESFSNPPSYRAILKSIKKHHALMSRNVDFSLDLETGEGLIFAGMRSVGKMRVRKEQAA